MIHYSTTIMMMLFKNENSGTTLEFVSDGFPEGSHISNQPSVCMVLYGTNILYVHSKHIFYLQRKLQVRYLLPSCIQFVRVVQCIFSWSQRGNQETRGYKNINSAFSASKPGQKDVSTSGFIFWRQSCSGFLKVVLAKQEKIIIAHTLFVCATHWTNERRIDRMNAY
jgi:uncharacterized membrane protein YwzB